VVGEAGVEVGGSVTAGPERQPGRGPGSGLLGTECSGFVVVGDVGCHHLQYMPAQPS
jgi:hypothetical protein